MDDQPDECEPCRVTETFLADLAFVQEANTTQLTFTSEYHSRRGGKEILLPLSIEYGVCDSVQLGMDWVAFGYSQEDGRHPLRGSGDFGLSAKYAFHMNNPRNHLAAGFEFQFPTGRLGSDSIGYGPSLMFGRDFPRCHNAHVFGQLGLDCVQRVGAASGDEKEPVAHESFVATGVLVPLGNFCLSSEFTWNNNQWNHAGTVNEVYFAPGVTWKLSDSLQCGAAVPAGLNRQSDRFQIILRFMFEF